MNPIRPHLQLANILHPALPVHREMLPEELDSGGILALANEFFIADFDGVVQEGGRRRYLRWFWFLLAPLNLLSLPQALLLSPHPQISLDVYLHFFDFRQFYFEEGFIWRWWRRCGELLVLGGRGVRGEAGSLFLNAILDGDFVPELTNEGILVEGGTRDCGGRRIGREGRERGLPSGEDGVGEGAAFLPTAISCIHYKHFKGAWSLLIILQSFR